jgi:hypothetical protein
LKVGGTRSFLEAETPLDVSKFAGSDGEVGKAASSS